MGKPFEPGATIVGRGVINDDNFVGRRFLFRERADRLSYQGAMIKIRNHD